MKLWTYKTLKHDLSRTDQHSAIWRIALPMVLSNMTVPLVGIVDSAVMGHLPEAHYLAAVGLGAALFTFIVWTMGFLRMITTGLVAQAYGAEDRVAIREWLYLSSLLGLSVALLTLLCNPWLIELILWWIDGSAAVEASVLSYWNTRIWGLPFSLLNAVMIGWFLGMQTARIPFLMLLIINLSNILLDLYFVLGLGMTIEGVALASVIAEILGFAFGAYHVTRLLAQYPLTHKFQLAWHKLKRLLSLNGDLLIRTLALELVFFTIHARGAELGDEVMAINAILLNFLLLIANGLDGFANAVEALVGKAIGRNHWRDFRSSVNVGGFWSLLVSLLFALIFWLFIEQFIALITTIDSVIEAARPYHGYIIFMALISVWSFWLDGVFVGASQIGAMRNSMLIAVGVGFIPLYFLSKEFANHGLWWAFYGFMLLRALSSMLFLKLGIRAGQYIRFNQ